MITASGNSHHWRLRNVTRQWWSTAGGCLMWPACGKVHRWRLCNVTRQWCSTAGGCLMWPASGDSIYIYTRCGLENFLSLARKRNDVVRLPNFPTERRRRPRPPPPLRPPSRPPGVPGQPPRAPRRHPREPRPFSLWTAAVFR
jgi:hypothetical protein